MAGLTFHKNCFNCSKCARVLSADATFGRLAFYFLYLILSLLLLTLLLIHIYMKPVTTSPRNFMDRFIARTAMLQIMRSSAKSATRVFAAMFYMPESASLVSQSIGTRIALRVTNVTRSSWKYLFILLRWGKKKSSQYAWITTRRAT